MNDRQLRSFLQTVNFKSFSKAASASYISTPALIQQINLLEKNLGFSLFFRGQRGVTLTPAGELFYPAAEDILERYDKVCAKCLALECKKEELLTLRIAYPSEQFPPLIADACQAFCNEYPMARISFVTLPFNRHFDELISGGIDFTIIGEPKRKLLESLTFLPLKEDYLSFCMRPGHPLAGHALITPEDLNNSSILLGHYSYLQKSYRQLLRKTGATLQPIDKEYDLNTRMECLSSDKLFVIHSMWGSQYMPLLKVVPSNIRAGQIGVLYAKKPSVAVQKFLEFLRN